VKNLKCAKNKSNFGKNCPLEGTLGVLIPIYLEFGICFLIVYPNFVP